MSYDRVALIGLGLIASSMFWAMKRAGMSGHVTGYARSAETRDTARKIGLCDTVCDDLAAAVANADLVVLCVPIGAMGPVMAEMASYLKPGCTVSDVGSVKRAVIDAVQPHIGPNIHFVPAHPLAGTERSGPESGFAALFDNRWCLFTPNGADREAVTALSSYWQGLGANVDELDPDHHDLVLAVTSHAPHLIAYTMVGVADDLHRVTNSEVIIRLLGFGILLGLQPAIQPCGVMCFCPTKKLRWRFWAGSLKSFLRYNAQSAQAMVIFCMTISHVPVQSVVASSMRAKTLMPQILVVLRGRGFCN
jgi:cyclohexadieny/prephenate dehydrogenase